MALTDQLDSRVNRAKRKREAFLTAFLNQLTAGIGERGKEAKEEAKVQRVRAIASKKDFDARKAKINTLKDLTQKLITLGAEKEDLMYYIKDKNPVEALQTIYTEVSGLVEKANKIPNFDITKSMIKDILNVPADFKPPDMPMKEFWERTVNIFTEHEENFPSESTESFLGNLFYGAMNINANARIMRELESQMYLGNKSIAEINEIAAREAFGDPFKGQFGTRAAMDLSAAPPIYTQSDIERFEEDYKTLISQYHALEPQIIEDMFGISQEDQLKEGSANEKLRQLVTDLRQGITSGEKVEDKDGVYAKYAQSKGLPQMGQFLDPYSLGQRYAIDKAVSEFRRQKGINTDKVYKQVKPQLPFLEQFLLKKIEN